MTSQLSYITSSSYCFLSLFKFSNWSEFHVNIITGSGVMTISFYKGLTRNPEIGNPPVWVLSNIWRLGRVMNAKLCTNVSNKMLPHAPKCQGYSFDRFWVIKGKQRGWFSPTQIRGLNRRMNLSKTKRKNKSTESYWFSGIVNDSHHFTHISNFKSLSDT